jgi:hypothetical protein
MRERRTAILASIAGSCSEGLARAVEAGTRSRRLATIRASGIDTRLGSFVVFDV